MKNEHKKSKALNKAQAEAKKAAAEVQKSNQEVEIKKKHTVTVRQAYEASKAKIH